MPKFTNPSYKIQYRESYGWDDWTEEEDEETAMKIARQIIKQPSPSEEGFLAIRIVEVKRTIVFHAKRQIGDWETASSGDISKEGENESQD